MTDLEAAWSQILEVDRAIDAVVGRTMQRHVVAARILGMEKGDVKSIAQLECLKLLESFDPSRSVPFGAFVSSFLPGRLIDVLYPVRPDSSRPRGRQVWPSSLDTLRADTGFDAIGEELLERRVIENLHVDWWFPRLWDVLDNRERTILLDRVMVATPGSNVRMAERFMISESRVSQIAKSIGQMARAFAA